MNEYVFVFSISYVYWGIAFCGLYFGSCTSELFSVQVMHHAAGYGP
jgi:hypothetical protein